MVIFKYRELRHLFRKDLKTICYAICTRSPQLKGSQKALKATQPSFCLLSFLPSASSCDCACSPQELPCSSDTVPVFLGLSSLCHTWLSFENYSVGVPADPVYSQTKLFLSATQLHLSTRKDGCYILRVLLGKGRDSGYFTNIVYLKNTKGMCLNLPFTK